MKKTYMIEFELPHAFDEEFMALIPKQRYVINTMLADGRVKAYSLAMDRSRLWVIMTGNSEFDILEQIAQMPLSDYMDPDISELMFHNSSDAVMQFSLN